MSGERFLTLIGKLSVRFSLTLAFAAFLISSPVLEADDLNLLFLGDNGPHRPVDRFSQIAPKLAERGILIQYTDDVNNLNEETLNKFDGLVLYANIDSISKEHADALLEYVALGHGFIPLHCATYCFRNDPRIVDLMGAQFQRHGGEVRLYRGVIEGVISKALGEGGFGFDPYFLPNGETKTIGQSKPDRLNARAIALEAWRGGRCDGVYPVMTDWDGQWQ